LSHLNDGCCTGLPKRPMSCGQRSRKQTMEILHESNLALGLCVVTGGSSSEIARLPCALKPSMLKSLGGLFRANGTFRSIKYHLVSPLHHKPTWSRANPSRFSCKTQNWVGDMTSKRRSQTLSASDSLDSERAKRQLGTNNGSAVYDGCLVPSGRRRPAYLSSVQVARGRQDILPPPAAPRG
jgi:hypothetical protein